MPRNAAREVLDLGDDLPYQDGAEARILEILESAADRSSTSDELASHIVDWPTRYHFSRLRRDLLQPLVIAPGTRVLEIGCGTGVNLVTFAEMGAEVVGVEGSTGRARAARARTLQHETVTVYAGDAAALPPMDLFDIVVLVGVLEYSPAAVGGAAGPRAMLELARSWLKPDGSLVLAIENQIGLKYLLSHPEDHLGVPWIGLEGYPDRGSPRTWSRRELSLMLDRAGLSDQEWLYPFPDYKLPTFVARHELYQSERGRRVLQQFVRTPTADRAGPPWLVCDAKSAFDVMLDAGLGPETANSFLVVASSEPNVSRTRIGDGEAWISSGERLQKFRSDRAIRTDSGEIVIQQTSGPSDADPAVEGWVANVGHRQQPVELGHCLEDQVVDAVRADDIAELESLLRDYDGFLEAHRSSADDEVSHPFLIATDQPVLPADFLDCTLKNLVVDDDGTVHFVDREWSLAGGVDEGLIRLRSYFETAVRIAGSGVPHRWDDVDTIGDFVRALGEVAGHAWTDDTVARFAEAESEFQAIVSGGLSRATASVADVWATRLVDAATPAPTLSLLRRHQGESAAHERVAELERLHRELSAAYEELARAHRGLVDAHDEQTHTYQALLRAHAELSDDHRDLVEVQLRTEAALAESTGELQALRRSRSYRLGRLLGAPVRRLRRVGRPRGAVL